MHDSTNQVKEKTRLLTLSVTIVFVIIGVVLGLVGTNGIGKSTALKVLAGKQKPNLGRFNDPPGLEE